MMSTTNEVYFITAFANTAEKGFIGKVDQERECMQQLLAACQKHYPDIRQHEIPRAEIDHVIDAFIACRGRVAFFHFAGHADGQILEFGSAAAHASGLAGILKEQGCVPVVFLNGCSTQAQVDYFRDAGVGIVISTTVDVVDEYAYVFAQRFYQSFLAKDRTVEEAFGDARNALLTDEALNKSGLAATIRNTREAIPRSVSPEMLEAKERIWTMDVFDNNVLRLQIKDLGNFINRRKLVKPYAEWLVKQHSRLKVSGLEGATDIGLENVFVSLQGELSKSYEIFQTQVQLAERIKELERKFVDLNLPPEERKRQKSHLLGRSALIPALEERDKRVERNTGEKVRMLDLLEAFRTYDKLVILGDPGTGKTTVARWLVLIFAQALSQGGYIPELKVPLDRFTWDGRATGSGSFEHLRLPVLLRVSEYAERLREEPGLPLEDFLGAQGWLGEHPSLPAESLHLLMMDFINKGEALIILDGLDEIVDEREREEVKNRIMHFMQTILDRPPQFAHQSSNKFIVTSRIAGYHMNALLHEALYHVTIQPMPDEAIRHYVRTWVSATHRQIQTGKRKPLQIEIEAEELADGLIARIFDPAHPGVRELAGNPLLLTELGKMFYREKKLPETRVELYEKAARNMLDIWKDRIKDRLPEGIGILEEQLFFVLEDIAFHIHENYPTGLILRDEAEGVIEKSLEEFYEVNSHLKRRPHTRETEKADLLRIINEEVGILAARATELYGFLHLTFEEFFAARRLLRQPKKIAEKIVEKAYDPRWRQPLILAISYLDKKLPLPEERRKLLQALLDTPDTMGNIVPRSASLIALAIAEMNYLPEGDLIIDMVRKLCEAYCRAGVFEEGATLRNNVEETFRALKKNALIWPEIIKTVILQLKSIDSSAELKNGTAYLLYELEEFRAGITEALVDIREQDLERWEWPIHRTLQLVVSSRPEWIGPQQGLRMRKYLYDYRELLPVITRDQDWLKIFCVLYGGLVATGDEDRRVYTFSAEGIIHDSVLTKEIVSLLDDESSHEPLLGISEKMLNNTNAPVQDRVDAFMVLAIFQDTFPAEFVAGIRPEEQGLFEAIKTRISRLNRLLEQPVGNLIKKSLNGLDTILGHYTDNEAFHLVSALFKVELAYNKKVSSPLVWIAAAPEHLRAQFLTDVWLQPFFTEDGAYSLSVILDTSGAGILRLGLDTIARSLAYVSDAVVMPPYEKWRIRRTFFPPVTEEEILERALFNLLALSYDFDFLKFWGFKTLQPLWSRHAWLQPVIELFLYRIKNDELHKATRELLGREEESGEMPTDEELQGKVIATDRYFTIIYPSRSLVYFGRKRLKNSNAQPAEVQTPGKALAAIFEDVVWTGQTLLRYEPGAAEYIRQKLEEATQLIERLDLPQDKIRAWLKLADYFDEAGERGALILRCLETVKEIGDPYVYSQYLKEIRPWTVAQPVARALWDSLYAGLDSALFRSIVDGRLYPQIRKFPDSPDNNLPGVFTQLGGLVRDLTQLFALPGDVDGLWELLRFSEASRVEAIIEQLYKIGVARRIPLGLPGARALDDLLAGNRTALVKKLIPCLEYPTLECLDVVVGWMDHADPEIVLFASLLLLEAGILNKMTFAHLRLCLLGQRFASQDQLRNRINLALNRTTFYLTQLEYEGVMEVQETISEYWQDTPYLLRGLAWLYEYLVFDDPEVLTKLIETAGGKGIKAERAARVLGNIQLIEPTSFGVYLQHLRNGSAGIQRRLLSSAIDIVKNLKKSVMPEELWSELRHTLCEKARSKDRDAAFFAIETLGYLHALTEGERELLREMASGEDGLGAELAIVALGRADFPMSIAFIRERLSDETLRNAAAEAIVRQLLKTETAPVETIQRIFNELGPKEDFALRALLAAGRSRWYDGPTKYCYKVLAAFFDRSPALYRQFVEASIDLIAIPPYRPGDFSYTSNISWMGRGMVLDALAAGAERLPSTFTGGIKNHPDVERHLCAIVRHDGIFTNRMNALTCLSLRRQMTQECAEAFCAALKDISEVQNTAISVMYRFWEIDRDFLRRVSGLLDSESYSARFAIVNMLAAIGRYNKGEANIRQNILTVLYSKLNDPAFQVPVFLLRKKISVFTAEDGAQTESEEGNIVEYKGRLDQEIYKRILEVAGIRANQDQKP
jgi:hypothetical protein